MARKKKEEIKEELATPTTPVAIIAPILENETATADEKTDAPKKKKATKKPAPKTSAKQKKTKKQTEQAVETVEETKETATAAEKAEEIPAQEPAKPKRGRKPATKKKEEKTATKEPIREEEKPLENTVPEEKSQPKKTATRAEKNETIKSLIKELLSSRPYKWSELLAESGRLYEQRIEEKDGHVANDVRGRVGSVFDVMKKDGEVVFEGGMYALKQALTPKTEENPLPEIQEKSTETKENTEEQPTAKEEKTEITPVFDMSLLLENKAKTEKNEEIKKADENTEKVEKTEEKTTKIVQKQQLKKQEKPAIKKAEPKQEKRAVEKAEKRSPRANGNKLKETFLKKVRALGGKYFEYYSIYLLERYSLRNGRRVDGFKVSGGENDGGIDGEIEVTDRIGFKETIYVQAKNWKPIYGKEDSWVIGETALREFIGAVEYRQVKEGKHRCRGIFITSSYFTAGAKEMLDKMSDRFVGYDGDDLFETAKECSFGLIQKDGEWQLDERVFAGEKAFFNLYD